MSFVYATEMANYKSVDSLLAPNIFSIQDRNLMFFETVLVLFSAFFVGKIYTLGAGRTPAKVNGNSGFFKGIYSPIEQINQRLYFLQGRSLDYVAISQIPRSFFSAIKIVVYSCYSFYFLSVVCVLLNRFYFSSVGERGQYETNLLLYGILYWIHDYDLALIHMGWFLVFIAPLIFAGGCFFLSVYLNIWMLMYGLRKNILGLFLCFAHGISILMPIVLFWIMTLIGILYYVARGSEFAALSYGALFMLLGGMFAYFYTFSIAKLMHVNFGIPLGYRSFAAGFLPGLVGLVPFVSGALIYIAYALPRLD